MGGNVIVLRCRILEYLGGIETGQREKEAWRGEMILEYLGGIETTKLEETKGSL